MRGNEYSQLHAQDGYNHGADGNGAGRLREARHRHAFWMLFALVCGFDTLFSFLLFVVIGHDYTGGLSGYFKATVVHYSFRSSVFDVVIISLARSFLLSAFYWYLNHGKGKLVLITTLLSSVFLIIKVFYYSFSNGIPSYIMFVTAFIMPWVESWLWAVKIWWDERRAIEAADNATHPLKRYDETTPLIAGPGYSQPTQRWSSRRMEGVSVHSTPIGTPFGTPPETSQSFFGDDVVTDADANGYVAGPSQGPLHNQHMHSHAVQQQQGRPQHIQRALTPRDLKYIAEVREALDLLRTLGSSFDGWKLEKEADGVLVHSRPSPGVKLFRSTAIVEMSPRAVFEMVYYNIESQPNWNKAMTEYRTIETINDITDITYAMAAEAAGGMVSPRDFVNIRQWRLCEDGTYLCGGTGTTHERCPERQGITRGLNGPGGFVLLPVKERPGCTQFVWVVNSDIKGWLPKYVVDQAMTGVIIAFNGMLQSHVQSLAEGKVAAQ
eukprot:Opistho-2@94548